MIFPIGDDQVKGGCRPWFSYSFIVLNVLFFLFKFSLNPAHGHVRPPSDRAPNPDHPDRPAWLAGPLPQHHASRMPQLV